MVTDVEFEQGRNELEALLNREVSATEDVRNYEIQCWIEGVKEEEKQFSSDEEIEEIFKDYTPEVVEFRLKEEPVFIYVRTDQDYFIGKGTHQAVLDLKNGLVAKGPSDRGKPTIWSVMKKYPTILPFGYGRYGFTKETVDHLKATFGGTDIVVPEISFYRVGWNKEKNRVVVSPNVYNAHFRDLGKLLVGEIEPEFPSPNVCVTTDLRESGRFRVLDYDEKVTRNLTNGDEIVKQFDSAYVFLMEHYDGDRDAENLDPSRGPYLARKPHGPDFSADTAIRNMFLLQVPIDREENGRLVIGDIDHVCLFQ